MAKETNVIPPSVNNNNNNDLTNLSSSPTNLLKDTNQLINNQTKMFSGGPVKPLPPETLKCNILKARAEEELLAASPTKLTNQMFVTSASDDECSLLSSLNAATFVSVVTSRNIIIS